jgi:CRP-like cAMP-binding protein
MLALTLTIMAAYRLYETLFSAEHLPDELNNEREQKRLAAYLDNVMGASHHSHTQLLLSKGQEACYIYFLEKGMARGFYYDVQKGIERTIIFWKECSVFTDPFGFFDKLKAGLNIEVMAGSDVLFISRQQLTELYRSFPYAEAFTTRMTSYYTSYFARRSHDLVCLSAWERYEQLLRDYPGIELKVMKEYIASYIDVAPQSLSRLLKKNGHP